jgi:hypothetical protein
MQYALKMDAAVSSETSLQFFPFYVNLFQKKIVLNSSEFWKQVKYIEMLINGKNFKGRGTSNYHGHYQHRSDIARLSD